MQAAGAKQAAPPSPFRLLRRYTGRAAAAVVLFSFGSSLVDSWRTWKEYITLPPAFYLELDLEQQSLVERAPSSPLGLLRAAAGRQIELHSLIKVLHTAKTDERVRGLLALLGGRENFGGFAQLQELRNALLEFRLASKGRAPVFAYSNALGEGGLNATGVYLLATAADKVFMPPTGVCSLLGLESTQVFVRGLLDKLKVQPQVFRREQFKAALAPLMGTGFDPDHRENLTSLLGSLYEQAVAGIASARQLPASAVEQAIAASPLLPAQAAQMQLLDGLLYRDQVEQLMLQQLPAEAQQAAAALQQLAPTGRVPLAVELRRAQLAAPRVGLQRYTLAMQWSQGLKQMWGGGAQQQPLLDGATGSGAQPGQAGGSAQASLLLPANRPMLAVVTAAGPIMQAGGTDPTGAGADGVVESHKLVRALRALRNNPQVKAVVLRINSPGGSAVASDIIAREVQLLKEAGKPVVASLADVAASGGYFIAAPASRILAQPGTITGSIGVIFLKLYVADALREYGITGDTVRLGDNADWASGFHQLSPAQAQQVEGLIDATYNDFMNHVARGRGLSRDAVHAVAKGRVWSGSQAMEVGLVDEVGGLARAIQVAKALAGLPEDPAATQVVEWPPRRIPPFMRLLQSAGALPGSPSDDQPSPAAAFAESSGRAAAALQLLSLFASHAWSVGRLGQALELEGAGASADSVAAVAAAGGSLLQQPQVAAAASSAPMGSRLHQQLVRVLWHLGAAASAASPQLVCLEAEALAQAC